MTFETALTGLNAAAADLDVTGNNVANSGTVGFKYSRAEFADIYATSNLGASQNAIGQGVRLANVAQQFTQGQFNFTGNNLDLGISGNGFFRLQDGSGQVLYSRAGAFQLDKNGNIVNSKGQQLTGYQVDSSGAVTNSVAPLQVNTGGVSPNATTSISINANLKSTGTVPSVTPFDSTNPSSYNYSTSTTVYDSLGASHTDTLYFVKTSTANQWQMYSQLDSGTPQGPTTVQFNSDGSLNYVGSSGNTSTSYSFTIPGANTLTVKNDLSQLTQFGTPYSVSQLTQDGYAAGQFSSMSVGSDGKLLARYTNGQSQVLGQVALAQFQNPEKLQAVGDTNWEETFDSGTAITAAPGSSGAGSIQGGALEESNVDLTSQLVNMITAQRNYQANAQMIQTEKTVTQDILNIR